MARDLPVRRAHRLPGPCYARDHEGFSLTIAVAGREPVFEEIAFGRECLELLLPLCEATESLLYGYCFMPDHVHLVIGVGRRSLVDVIGEWKSLCFRARRRRGCALPFWQRSFWDHGIRGGERALRAAVLYVLINPVRAGLVNDWRDYPLVGSAVWRLEDL